MHITYEYETYIIYVEIDTSSPNSSLISIDKRITALRQEEASILQICSKLSNFIRQNSLTPYNDDILEYIRYFIREEEIKKDAGANNKDIIQGLQKMIEDYECEQKIFNTMLNNKTTYLTNNEYGPEDIFGLVSQLYKLPINGPSIRQQIEGLKQKQLQVNEKKNILFTYHSKLILLQ